MHKKTTIISIISLSVILLGIFATTVLHENSVTAKKSSSKLQEKTISPGQVDYQTFMNQIANFEIKYPTSWLKNGSQQISDDDSRIFGQRLDTFVQMYSPQKTTNPPIPNNVDFGVKLSNIQKAVFKDMPQAYFNIYVTNANENVDRINVAFKPTVTALSEFNNAKGTLDTDPLFHSREITEGKILLNDNKTQAYTLEQIKSSSSNKDWRNITHVFFNSPDNSKVYELEYGADVQKMSDYMPIFKTMMNSFRFLNS